MIPTSNPTAMPTSFTNYSVSFKTFDGRFNCESDSTFYFKLINNCDRNASTPVQCTSYKMATEEQTFIPADLGEQSIVSWNGLDIENVTQIEIGYSLGNDGWCMSDFIISKGNIEMNCSLNFMQYLWLDNDCSAGGGYKSALMDLGKVCAQNITNTNSNTGDQAVSTDTGSSNNTLQYKVYFHTLGDSACHSSGTFRVTLINNCSFDDSNLYGDSYACKDSKHTYPTSPITMSDLCGSQTKWLNFSDYDIGDITNMVISTRTTDGWCFDSFGILIDGENENGKWIHCSMDFMGWFMMDNDCSVTGGSGQLNVDVSTNSPICHTGICIISDSLCCHLLKLYFDCIQLFCLIEFIEVLVNGNKNELCNINKWNTIQGNWNYDSINCSLYNSDYNDGNVIWIGTQDGLTFDSDYDFHSFVVELGLSFNMSTGGNSGILFRAITVSDTDGGDSQYFFGVDTGNNAILGRINNGWTQLLSESMTVSTDTLYRLKIVCNGTLYDFYVNDELTDYFSGSFGLRTSLQPAFFHYFKIWNQTQGIKSISFLYNIYIN